MLVQSQRMRNQECPKDIWVVESLRVPWLRSYIEAFARRIGERLVEQRRNAETSYGQETYGPSLLPALRSKTVAVSDEYARMFPHARSTRSRHRRSADGAMAGRAAADRADIGNRQLRNRRELGK